jgi:hypothetical protein
MSNNLENLKGRELEKHSSRLEANVKVDLKVIDCDDMDWIQLAQAKIQ